MDREGRGRVLHQRNAWGLNLEYPLGEICHKVDTCQLNVSRLKPCIQDNSILICEPSYICAFMGSSAYLIAKRAFVKVLLSLATVYLVCVSVNRDSDDEDVLKANHTPGGTKRNLSGSRE